MRCILPQKNEQDEQVVSLGKIVHLAVSTRLKAEVRLENLGIGHAIPEKGSCTQFTTYYLSKRTKRKSNPQHTQNIIPKQHQSANEISLAMLAYQFAVKSK